MKIHKFTNFEIASLGGIISLISDLFWLIRDTWINGFSGSYLLIGIGLVLGIIFVGQAWYKHYTKNIKHRSHKKIKNAIPSVNDPKYSIRRV